MEEQGGYTYSRDQISEIYAKLEVAKLLSQMSKDIAAQAADDVKFYRMTNGMAPFEEE